MCDRHPGTPDTAPTASIVFARLTEVSLGDITALLNEPRNTRHMPLSRHFTEDDAAEWVQAKDNQWNNHGYGPWAIIINGDFAGWGGFQHEPNGSDYALVLTPQHWGSGDAITRQALRMGFNDFDLEAIIIALPLSRNPDRVVSRLGFRPDGHVVYNGTEFRQYRLGRQDAAQRDPAIVPASPR